MILALTALAFSTDMAEPQDAKWTMILVLGALGLVLARRLNAVGAIALALLAWGAVSLSWSADWRNGIVVMTHAGALLGCSLLAVRAAHVAPSALATAMIGAAVIWVFGPPWLFGGFGNRNFAAEFVLMAAPFAWLSPLRWWALLAGGWVVIDNHGALKWLALALGLGSVVVLPAWRRRDLGPALGAFAGLLGIMLMVAWPDKLLTSLKARGELGWNTLAMIADRPFFGWGLGSFNAVYPDYSERHRAVLGDWTVLESAARFAGASHNEFLQLHAELGLVGWALFLACIVVLARHAWRKKRDRLDLAAGASLGVAALLSLIAFPLQNAATAMVAGLSVTILARGLTAWTLPRARLLATGLAAGWLIWTAPRQVLASVHYGAAVRTGNAHPSFALLADLKAIEAWPYLRGPRHQLELLLSGAVEQPGFQIDPREADRWHRISVSAAGNDPAVLLARLAYLAHAGRMDEPEAHSTFRALIERHSLRPGVKALAEMVR